MKKFITLGIVALNCMLFTACSIETSTGLDETTSNQNNVAQQEEVRENQTNIENNQNQNNMNQNNPQNNSSLQNPTNNNPSQNQLISQIFEQAKLGKVYLEFRYGIGSNVQDILQYYGQPDAGDPGYLNYMKSRFVSFAVSKNNQVSEILSNHPKFQQLTQQQIVSQLGAPQNKGYQKGTGEYILYQAGPYQLLFFFNNSNVSYIAVKS